MSKFYYIATSLLSKIVMCLEIQMHDCGGLILVLGVKIKVKSFAQHPVVNVVCAAIRASFLDALEAFVQMFEHDMETFVCFACTRCMCIIDDHALDFRTARIKIKKEGLKIRFEDVDN